MSECPTYTTNELAYLGLDNAVSIIPYSDYSDRVNWDMSTTTRVDVSADLTTSVATGDDITADSTNDPTLVWYNQDADGVWQIHMKVGLFVGITAGEWKLRVSIVDAVNTNGVVIADDLLVTVVDIP